MTVEERHTYVAHSCKLMSGLVGQEFLIDKLSYNQLDLVSGVCGSLELQWWKEHVDVTAGSEVPYVADLINEKITRECTREEEERAMKEEVRARKEEERAREINDKIAREEECAREINYKIAREEERAREIKMIRLMLRVQERRKRSARMLIRLISARGNATAPNAAATWDAPTMSVRKEFVSGMAQ
jgi:hypothetical protein